MFSPEEFAKNHFILDKKDFSYCENDYKSDDYMHIAFNLDNNFMMQMGVTITSILKNNREKVFWFHVFCDGISEDNLEKFKKTLQRYKVKGTVYIMDMKPFQGFHIKTQHFSRVTYIRTVMPKILKELTKKYLYMDADMLCVGDISEIERIDLDGYPLAAATETEEAVRYKTTFLHQKSGKHFNSGLQWVDIDAWERKRITERVFEYQGADPNRFAGHDQDIMNLVLDGEIKFLDRRFNGGSENGVLIYHFAGRDKPWQMVLGDSDRLWRHYLDLSEWDSMPDPNPPKIPKYYFAYKRKMIYHNNRHEYGQMLYCLFWYSLLKIKYKLHIK